MDEQKQQKLAANSLNIIESIVMGTAGAAPAFSLAAAMAVFIGALGILSPASILYSGFLIFGISLSFMHMNKVLVSAGTSYAWVSLVFGRFLGFFAGWALLSSSAVFMVSGSIPAATSTLLLFAPDQVNNPLWANSIAAIWLTFISFIALKGIKPSSYLQVIFTFTEITILSVIIIAGIIYFARTPQHEFSWAWFSLGGFTATTFAIGAIKSVFLYWGWDVSLSLSEETKDTTSSPGLGGFWSLLIIILLYVTFAIAALLMMSDAEIQNAGTNIVYVMADKLFPKPWSYLAIICVISSSLGTLETSVLQFSRTLYAESRDKAFHPRYSKLHPNWLTPWLATVIIWALGMLFLLLSADFKTVTNIIKVSVNAVGLQIVIYYSLTGFACAWYHRAAWRSPMDLISCIIWPLLSALFLVLVACYAVPSFDTMTMIIAFGGISSGLVPYFWNRWRSSAVA